MAEDANDFDAALSGAIDRAAGAAQPPGAVAARIRGRKRTVRRRVALSSMSFVLVAVGSTVMFSFSSSHGGVAPQPPAATSESKLLPVVSPTPGTPASSASATAPNPTGTPGATSPSSPSAPNTSNASGAPTTSSANTPYATAPSATWLTPQQMPFHELMNWSAGAPDRCTGSMVFNANYPGNCMTHSQPGDAHAAQKLDVVVFNAVGVPTGNGAWAQPDADQDFFTYANAADAQAAFQSVTGELLSEDKTFAGAIDPDTNRPIVSTTTVTAQSTGGMAIYHKLRDDHGAPGLVNGVYSGASDVHFYFVVKENILEVLEIRGGVSIGGTSNDKAILATIGSALN